MIKRSGRLFISTKILLKIGNLFSEKNPFTNGLADVFTRSSYVESTAGRHPNYLGEISVPVCKYSL